MLKRLKSFLGLSSAPVQAPPTRDLVSAPRASSENKRSSATENYFDTMAKMQESISNSEYQRAAAIAKEHLRHVPGFVRGWRSDYGKFDIQSMPGLEQGGTVLALIGDDSALDEIERLVKSHKELEPWIEYAVQHKRDRQLFTAILDAVSKNPNCLQTSIKDLLGETDGRRIGVLISYLDKARTIVRIKEGRTYKLLLPGMAGVPLSKEVPAARSHRSDRHSPKLHEIDATTIEYVPLPRSPVRWETTPVSEQQTTTTATEPFEIHDGTAWRIESIAKLTKTDRGDPAFRQMHPCDVGTFMIDDLGKAAGFGQIESAALRYDRNGQVVANAGLNRDIYRISVHPLGRGMIALSRDCVLHAYDESLRPLFETAISESPEAKDLKKRLGLSESKLKNFIRCVALSQDATRYMVTIMDEVWCISSGGQGLWGAKMPMNDGWARVAELSSTFGTSADVASALATMNLSLPITPEQIKKRYRNLPDSGIQI